MLVELRRQTCSAESYAASRCNSYEQKKLMKNDYCIALSLRFGDGQDGWCGCTRLLYFQCMCVRVRM
jgi:hypothetical protein